VTRIMLVGRYKPSLGSAPAGSMVTLLEAARAMDADNAAPATRVELHPFRVEAPRAMYAGAPLSRVGRYAVVPDSVRRTRRDA
jgi:hypothetical protein